MGIEESLRFTREAYYWPLMNAEIRDHVVQCSVCNSFRPEQELNPMNYLTDPGPKLAQTCLHLMARTMLLPLTTIPALLRWTSWLKPHHVQQLTYIYLDFCLTTSTCQWSRHIHHWLRDYLVIEPRHSFQCNQN